MSYRTIALASCLFLVACGGAAPPHAAVPSQPGEGSAAPAPPTPTATGEEKSSTMPIEDAPPSPVAKAGSPASSAADGGGSDKHVGQAVVESSEPLSGKLTSADIARILEKNGDVFGACYTLGAGGKMKDFKGVVTVKATIGPSGTVNHVDVTKSTAKNAKVDACVREAFKKIKFPRPQDGATSVITFPISFNGVEQIQ